MKKIIVVAASEMILAGYLNALYEAGFDSIGATNAEQVAEARTWFTPDLLVLAHGSAFENVENLPVLTHKGGVKGLIEAVNAHFFQ